MGNQGDNTTNNICWTWSPLWDPEVDNSIDEEYEDDKKKYLERDMLEFNIFPRNTIEPYTNEHTGSPEYNELPEELDYPRGFRSDELTSSDEESSIVGEESIEHDADCT